MVTPPRLGLWCGSGADDGWCGALVGAEDVVGVGFDQVGGTLVFVVLSALAALTGTGSGPHGSRPHATTAGRTGSRRCRAGPCRCGTAHRPGPGGRARTSPSTTGSASTAAGPEPGARDPAAAVASTAATAAGPETACQARGRDRTHAAGTEPAALGTTSAGWWPGHATTGVQPGGSCHRRHHTGPGGRPTPRRRSRGGSTEATTAAVASTTGRRRNRPSGHTGIP